MATAGNPPNDPHDDPVQLIADLRLLWLRFRKFFYGAATAFGSLLVWVAYSIHSQHGDLRGLKGKIEAIPTQLTALSTSVNKATEKVDGAVTALAKLEHVPDQVADLSKLPERITKFEELPMRLAALNDLPNRLKAVEALPERFAALESQTKSGFAQLDVLQKSLGEMKKAADDLRSELKEQALAVRELRQISGTPVKTLVVVAALKTPNDKKPADGGGVVYEFRLREPFRLVEHKLGGRANHYQMHIDVPASVGEQLPAAIFDAHVQTTDATGEAAIVVSIWVADSKGLDAILARESGIVVQLHISS